MPVTLEEIASRIQDKSNYDITKEQIDWKPKKADDYTLPDFNIRESSAKGAKAKLRTKLSKVLAFVDSVYKYYYIYSS